MCVCNLLFCFLNGDLFCTYRPPYHLLYMYSILGRGSFYFNSGLQTKKSRVRSHWLLEEKNLGAKLFFMCRRIKVFYFIIIILFFSLHFNISIILSCVYVSSFLDFISILIHLVDDQVDLGTKVHLKWELNVFSNLKYTVTKNCSLHRICTNIMDP